MSSNVCQRRALLFYVESEPRGTSPVPNVGSLVFTPWKYAICPDRDLNRDPSDWRTRVQPRGDCDSPSYLRVAVHRWGRYNQRCIYTYAPCETPLGGRSLRFYTVNWCTGPAFRSWCRCSPDRRRRCTMSESPDEKTRRTRASSLRSFLRCRTIPELCSTLETRYVCGKSSL